MIEGTVRVEGPMIAARTVRQGESLSASLTEGTVRIDVGARGASSNREVPVSAPVVSAADVTAGFRMHLVPEGARWTPALSVEAGPMFVKGRSRPDDGYSGRTLTSVTALVSGTFSLAVAVNKILSIKAEVSGGAAVKKLRFAVSDEPLISFGHPLLSVALGLSLRLL